MTVDSYFRIDNGQLTIDNFGEVRGTFLVFYRAKNNDRRIKINSNRNKFDVGAAISRPPRWMYNLWGEWYHPHYGTPTVAAATCRQPARRAGIVVRLYLFRPTQKRLLYGVVPFNLTGYICNGPAPRRGWSGVGSTPLHCSVYWVVPFNPTGYIRYVAGGKIAAPTRALT